MTRKFVVNLDMIRVVSLMNYYNDIIVYHNGMPIIMIIIIII